MKQLVLKDVCKKYPNQLNYALDHINLIVEKGEFVAVMGRSGSGKTTLLNVTSIIDKIDSGNIYCADKEISTFSDKEATNFRKNDIGFVFQDFQLFPHLSVLDNLTLSPVKTMGMTKETAKEKAVTLLQRLGLGEYADAYPYSLSGGQKQRVALARAMMIDPQIIGYDEPTSALDPELRQEVEKLILQNREAGMTQIVVTHDLKFAESISDHILRINPK